MSPLTYLPSIYGNSANADAWNLRLALCLPENIQKTLFRYFSDSATVQFQSYRPIPTVVRYVSLFSSVFVLPIWDWGEISTIHSTTPFLLTCLLPARYTIQSLCSPFENEYFLLRARCTKDIFHFSVCSKSAQKVLLFFYLSPLSFPHHDNTEDTSKHTGACLCLLCPYLSLFNVTWTQRTWTSTLVLTCVLYISVLVPSTPCRHTGHKWAHWCSLMSYMSLFLSLYISLWHWVDAQDMSEHISAHLCPYFSLQHCVDAHDTSEHQHAHLCCGYCNYHPFNMAWMPRTWVSTLVLTLVMGVFIFIPLTLFCHSAHDRAAFYVLYVYSLLSLTLWTPRTWVSTACSCCGYPCFYFFDYYIYCNYLVIDIQ